jgi:DNA-binding transcriptional ArsR family regulator
MYSDLDPIIHSPLRLAIISMLMASEKVEFTHIMEETKAAAGNISIQMKNLEDAGYIIEIYVNNLKKYIYPK